LVDAAGYTEYRIGVKTMLNVGYGEKLHSATKLAALCEALFAEGIPPGDVMRGVQLAVEDLHLPTTRVSIDQMIETCRNAIRLSSDPQLAFRVGSSIHLSAYGMYGYAMLCSTNFRTTMEFAVRYHQLATPLTTIAFEEFPTSARWTIAPLPHPRLNPVLYEFVTELQIGIHLSLMRDVIGASFSAREICLVSPAASARLTPDLVGCPVVYEHSANQIVLDTSWLDRVPTLGNRATHAAMLEVCDRLVTDLGRRTGISGRVRQVLLEDIAQSPNLESVAMRLRTTARTLRRQLRTEDTSFQALFDEFRMQLAIRYLRDTDMTGEDIATAVGISDAANFRRAFRRWTGKSPNEFKECGL
jgi:AraC-like DNA-binding protein